MGIGRRRIRSSLGKTVEVEVAVSRGRISRALISGDFFAFPADVVYRLEEAMTGLPADPEAISRLEELELGGELVGVSLSDVIDAARSALSRALSHEGEE